MENKEQENAWRISYAEKLVRKTESYRRSLRTPQPDSVLGIYRDTQIRVNRWIETMLTLNDQLEYGIVGAERTTKRTEYQREKLLMMDFRKILKRNLYRPARVIVSRKSAGK